MFVNFIQTVYSVFDVEEDARLEWCHKVVLIQYFYVASRAIPSETKNKLDWWRKKYFSG